MKRNNPQPRGRSGKFSPSTPLSGSDLLRHARTVEAGYDQARCLLPPQKLPYGRIVGNQWVILRRGDQFVAHKLIWEDYYGLPLGRKRLKQFCKTPGCLEPTHYKVTSTLDELI